MSLGQPLPVLMYHHISPKPGLVSCSPDNFRAHMLWLVENGWKTLSTDAFTQILATGEVPKKSVLVTFDDARAEAALGLLAALGRRTQVILFTHHAHVAELARRRDDVAVQRLAPAA